jgi:hypothetical protein
LIKIYFLLIIIFSSFVFAQTDTVLVPLKFGFTPSLRTVTAEASSFLFIYSSYGATVDLDLFQLPYATVQGAGIRINYQEYRRGLFRSFNDQEKPISYISSAFLRASFKRENTRSDVFFGISSSDPRTSKTEHQLQFGVDLRSMIVKPLSALFIRIIGSSSGVSVQFGISVGYID